MGWQGGAGLALASAFVTNLGFLWRHRGAVAAPDVDARHPLRSAIGLFSTKWWTIGYAAAFVAWVLHVGALSLAPLSIVQTALAGGFVFLAVLAEKFFGFELGRREWAGVLLSAVGLAFLASTAGEVNGKQSEYDMLPIVAFELGMVAIGALLIVGQGSRIGGGPRTGVLLGAGRGRAVHCHARGAEGAHRQVRRPRLVLSPWTAIIVVGGVIAFFASARSLQVGARGAGRSPPPRSPATPPRSSRASWSSATRSAATPCSPPCASGPSPRRDRRRAHAGADSRGGRAARARESARAQRPAPQSSIDDWFARPHRDG